MLESCTGMSSTLHRSRLVSWCVDSATSPPSENTPLTTTETPDQQPAGAGHVPLLLLSPPETREKLNNAVFVHHSPNPASAKRIHHEAPPQPSHIQLNPHPEADRQTMKSLDEGFHLPRSSPVISRCHRLVFWSGGVNDSASPSRPNSDFLSPTSDSLGQCERPTGDSMEDLSPCLSAVQEDKKQQHLFRESQEMGGEQKGQDLGTGCSNTSGLSTSSTQHHQERRSSGIPEFPADIFKSSCELEKENAHFIVVDMVLEVLEGVKWTRRFNGLFSKPDTRCKACTAGEVAQEKNKNRLAYEGFKTSYGNTQSSEEYGHTCLHTWGEEKEWKAENDEAEAQPKTFSVLSTDSGFEDSAEFNMLTQRQRPINAEWLAQQLVLEFRRSWFPSRELWRDRLSLRSSLQELPGTGGVVCSGSLTEEIRLRTRMRGSLSWAPPCLQIIYTVQPTHRRCEVVALQQFLCAGCGTEVEPRYIKKLRYCEYLGRYFCDCCHSGSEAVIPGRVLSSWDFSRYPVSDFSKQLLDSVWHQPLFDLTCVAKTLYSQVKELSKFRDLQNQLLSIKKLLKACRLSEGVLKEFEQLPAHLTEQPHLFSMDDLLRVKRGYLVAQARAVLHSAVKHVESCELCLARGFICEFCREKDVIFPFQSDICKRCPACKACFHKHCFVGKKCSKCARIQTRRKLPD